MRVGALLKLKKKGLDVGVCQVKRRSAKKIRWSDSSEKILKMDKNKSMFWFYGLKQEEAIYPTASWGLPATLKGVPGSGENLLIPIDKDNTDGQAQRALVSTWCQFSGSLNEKGAIL